MLELRLIRASTSVRDLGVLLESDLSMRRHVAWTVGCSFRQLRLIRSCIKSLPPGAAKAAVAAFVTSRVDHYNSLHAGAPACLLDGLQSVLNAAARLVCNRRKYDHVTPLFRDVLHWLSVPFCIEYKLCLLVFLSLHGAAPEYLRDCCIGTQSFLRVCDLFYDLFVLLTQWTHLKCSLKLTCSCGIFVVRGVRLHRALNRCVLQGTAPRPGFGFPALPVLQCGILLFFLGLGFLQLPIHSALGSYLHFLYLRVDL